MEYVDTKISQSHRQKSVTTFSATKTDRVIPKKMTQIKDKHLTNNQYSVESQEQCRLNLYSKHQDEDENRQWRI